MSKRKYAEDVRGRGGSRIEERGGNGLLVLAVFVGGLFGVWWVSGYLQAYAPDAVAAAHVNLGTWVIGVPVALLVAACFRGGSR